VRGPLLATLPAARVREADGPGRGGRVLLHLARPDPLLVLRDAPARAEPGGDGAGAPRRGGAAQAGAGANRGAGAGPQPDRGRVRVAAGLGVLPRLGAGALRAARILAAPGRLPAQAARGDRGRPPARGPALLRGRAQERVGAPARSRRRGRRRDGVAVSRPGRLLAALVLAVVLAAGGEAAVPLAHRETLPNGAVLLVAERPAIPIVVVRVSMAGGAVRDPGDGAGLANLTAELLTRGTAHRSGPELDRAIEFVGGGLDAGAGRDGVTVTLSVLKKDLPLGLDLLGEVLREPTFPAEEMTRKVADIQASLRRAEQSPDTVAGRAIGPMMFPGHPYGRPAAGTVESVGKLTRDQVVAFHRLYYRPDGASIVVVGDVTT